MPTMFTVKSNQSLLICVPVLARMFLLLKYARVSTKHAEPIRSRHRATLLARRQEHRSENGIDNADCDHRDHQIQPRKKKHGAHPLRARRQEEASRMPVAHNSEPGREMDEKKENVHQAAMHLQTIQPFFFYD